MSCNSYVSLVLTFLKSFKCNRQFEGVAAAGAAGVAAVLAAAARGAPGRRAARSLVALKVGFAYHIISYKII